MRQAKWMNEWMRKKERKTEKKMKKIKTENKATDFCYGKTSHIHRLISVTMNCLLRITQCSLLNHHNPASFDIQKYTNQIQYKATETHTHNHFPQQTNEHQIILIKWSQKLKNRRATTNWRCQPIRRII